MIVLRVLVAAFSVVAVMLPLFGDKDAWWRKWVQSGLTVLAVGGTFAVGQIETASKQADVDDQRATLAKIERNVAELVAQGRLSREDAKRIFVVMSESIDTSKWKEKVDIKVTDPLPADKR